MQMDSHPCWILSFHGSLLPKAPSPPSLQSPSSSQEPKRDTFPSPAASLSTREASRFCYAPPWKFPLGLSTEGEFLPFPLPRLRITTTSRGRTTGGCFILSCQTPGNRSESQAWQGASCLTKYPVNWLPSCQFLLKVCSTVLQLLSRKSD